MTRTTNGQKSRCDSVKETLGDNRAHNLSRYHKMMIECAKVAVLLVHVEDCCCYYNYLQ